MSNNRIFAFFLKKIISERYHEAAVGDMLEIYRSRVEAGGLTARIWLAHQILAAIYSMLLKNLTGSTAMFKSYFLMAWRNLRKHRAYTLINVFGMALGLSAAILILLYLQFEISYDRFHEHGDHIFRVSIRSIKEGNVEEDSHIFTPPIGPDMKKDFPEVVDFVRMSTLRPGYLNIGDVGYKVDDVCYASPGMFEVFSFRLKYGDSRRALSDPYSIVLSERTASRLFGTQNPLGQTVMIGPDHLYTITGVAENPPANSTIQFNALISFATLYSLPGMYLDWNGGNQYITHIRLAEQTDAASVERKLPDFLWRYINETIAPYGWRYEAYLQPLNKIHFHHDESSQTALANFYTFTAVALFILIIACINFINLTTARAARRAREVGMRKVIGAHRGNLVRQFLGESILLTILAFLAGIVLAAILTPVYNQLLNKALNPAALLNGTGLLGLIGLVLIVGIAAGLYPAFYLSSFQPVKTLKGIIHSAGGKRKFRNSLVVFQIAISVTLIVCTFLIRDQIRHIKKVDLGYAKENMVVIPLADRSLRTRTDEVRTNLLAVPGIVQAAASSEVPHAGFTSNGYIPQGYTQSIMIHALDVDHHFLETYDIEVMKGRGFSKAFTTDREAYLINETLARQLGWDDPIGKIIHRNQDREVIGVVEDFKFATLHDQVKPLLITNNPWGNRYQFMSIKIDTVDIEKTLASVKGIFKKISPLVPFEYFFLDDAFDRLYKNEERFERIFQYFSLLAIVIALLGLFSLSAYTAQQKAKEIGIRKVLGATVPNILSLFSREMIFLIIAANAIAFPVAVYVIHKWLDNFAYRMSISIWAFLLAFAVSMLAAFVTIGYQSLKAAFKKPVEELRSE